MKSSNEQLSGLANVGAVIAPPPGFGFKPIEISNRNMQFLETQKYTREQICGLFNVPTPLVGDISKATYSNMRQILIFLSARGGQSTAGSRHRCAHIGAVLGPA